MATPATMTWPCGNGRWDGGDGAGRRPDGFRMASGTAGMMDDGSDGTMGGGTGCSMDMRRRKRLRISGRRQHSWPWPGRRAAGVPRRRRSASDRGCNGSFALKVMGLRVGVHQCARLRGGRGASAAAAAAVSVDEHLACAATVPTRARATSLLSSLAGRGWGPRRPRNSQQLQAGGVLRRSGPASAAVAWRDPPPEG